MKLIPKVLTGPYDYENYDDSVVMDDRQEEGKVYKMKETHFSDLKPDDQMNRNVGSDDDDGDDNDDDDSDTGTFFKRDTYGVSWRVYILFCTELNLYNSV